MGLGRKAKRSHRDWPALLPAGYSVDDTYSAEPNESSEPRAVSEPKDDPREAMSATLNPSPFVLATLQNLSTMTASRGVGHIFSRPIKGHSEARAFGGLDLAMARTGRDGPAKVRYGAIRVTPRSTGSAYSKSPGVHHAIDRGYDNPGVRFGDHIRSGRPVSAAGETSCHFSQTSVSKTSPIREMIKAARGGRRRTGSKAAAHVLYVERDGAAEKIDKYELLYGARFTNEIERRAADRSAVAQQAYIERAGAAECIERVPGRPITDDDLDALDEGSFGTIGNTVTERTRFWEAVEAAEATPKGDRIVVKPADNPSWLERAVKVANGAPAAARAAIQAAHASGNHDAFELKLPTDKAFAFHQWAVALDTEASLEISPGRGGRTQTRIIAELPHELDGRERLQVVRDFANLLTAKGFPFWAVIHAPDDNNDARNYHVHIAYYDRPCRKVLTAEKKEVWDFEVLEERRYPNRTKYLVRPHQQNRDRTTHDREWITILRRHWETSTNRVLEDAGQTKRYNLGTYASMGIALEPQKHINPRTFNKERKGELTEDGPVLARRQWDAAQDAALKDHQSQAERRFARINALAEMATAGMERHPQRGLAMDLVERLRVLGVEVSAEKARADLMLNLGRIVMDRVMSRPKLIMFDAIKEDDKTRRKNGKAATDPVPDRPVPSAEMFGPVTRNELSAFIVAMSDVALKHDKEHERFVQVANSRFKHVLVGLKAWAEHPMQPVTGAHILRLHGERPIDPSGIERQRRNRIAAFQADFTKRLEATLPEFLETVARRTAESVGTETAMPSAASAQKSVQPETATHSRSASTLLRPDASHDNPIDRLQAMESPTAASPSRFSAIKHLSSAQKPPERSDGAPRSLPHPVGQANFRSSASKEPAIQPSTSMQAPAARLRSLDGLQPPPVASPAQTAGATSLTTDRQGDVAAVPAPLDGSVAGRPPEPVRSITQIGSTSAAQARALDHSVLTTSQSPKPIDFPTEANVADQRNSNTNKKSEIGGHNLLNEAEFVFNNNIKRNIPDINNNQSPTLPSNVRADLRPDLSKDELGSMNVSGHEINRTNSGTAETLNNLVSDGVSHTAKDASDILKKRRDGEPAFDPSNIKIVGAERPSKRPSPKQRQRIRDFDIER